MARFLCIENAGEVDVRGFYVMGMSSKTGEDDMIGQFGTGTKYGITALLRDGHEVQVTSGKSKISFLTSEDNFRGKSFKTVSVKKGRSIFQTGLTVEMGQIHWDSVKAIRELVSNAVDEGEFNIIETDDVNGSPGVTRVFISESKYVKAFMKDFDRHFVINREPLFKSEDVSVFDKIGRGLLVFRRGVQVYEDEGTTAVFDYDFDDLDVGEDRKSSRWDVCWSLKSQILEFPVELKRKVFEAVSGIDSESFIESKLEMNYGSCGDDWKEIVGDRVVVDEQVASVYREHLLGYNIVVVPYNWMKFLEKNEGIKTIKSVLSNSTLKGWEQVKSDLYTEAVIDDALQFLRDVGYKISREDIIVADNSSESAPLGQYVDGKYYINQSSIRKGSDDVLVTLTHEMFHALSSAGDETRAFEDFIIKESIYHMKRLRLLLKKVQEGDNGEEGIEQSIVSACIES